MDKNRLEAFSDGVIAIIITVMVLEMKVPHEPDFTALKPVLPVFFTYVLSYVYVGIYWNNHHHLLKACRRVNAGIMWANQHLLFWMSLFPFVTGWMGENHFMPLPSALNKAPIRALPPQSGVTSRAKFHPSFTPLASWLRFLRLWLQVAFTPLLR